MEYEGNFCTGWLLIRRISGERDVRPELQTTQWKIDGSNVNDVRKILNLSGKSLFWKFMLKLLENRKLYVNQVIFFFQKNILIMIPRILNFEIQLNWIGENWKYFSGGW